MKLRSTAILTLALLTNQTLAKDEGETNKTREKDLHLIIGGALFADSSNFNSEMDDIFTGTNVDFEEDNNGLGHNVYLGVEAGDYVGLRLGKRELGEQRSEVYDSFGQIGDATLEADGNFLAVDLMYPLNRSVFLGITLGQYSWDTTTTFEGPGGIATVDEDGRDNFVGLRGQALLGDGSWVATFTLESHELEHDDTISFEYTGSGFGVEHRF